MASRAAVKSFVLRSSETERPQVDHRNRVPVDDHRATAGTDHGQGRCTAAPIGVTRAAHGSA